MYTRESLNRNYTVYAPPAVIVPGTVRVVVRDNIPQTWAIARPGTSPQPDGAPHYVSRYLPNQMIRGGFMGLRPPVPNIEMDPSDPTTWQRRYQFS